MKIQAIIDKLNLTTLTNVVNRDVNEVYISDLLSDAMSEARPGNLWITTQSHKNAVASAHLLDLAAIIIPCGETVPQDTIELANRYKVVILCCGLDHAELVRKLSTMGLQVRAEAKYKEMLEEALKSCDGVAPCFTYSTIFEAVENNDISIVEKFLKEGTDINVKDETGGTPLHWTSFYGLQELAELLVAKGANVYAHDNDGWTPLHWAKAKKILEFLLSKGADVNSRDQFGQTPLHILAIDSLPDVIGFLISKGAQVNDKDSMGKTPLHFAVLKGNVEVAAYLISQGAQVNAKENTGKTPLHLAAIKGYKEVAEALIKSGGDCDIKDNEGKSSIDYALERGHKSLATLCQKKRGG
jgi:ankyrin repeat protein